MNLDYQSHNNVTISSVAIINNDFKRFIDTTSQVNIPIKCITKHIYHKKTGQRNEIKTNH